MRRKNKIFISEFRSKLKHFLFKTVIIIFLINCCNLNSLMETLPQKMIIKLPPSKLNGILDHWQAAIISLIFSGPSKEAIFLSFRTLQDFNWLRGGGGWLGGWVPEAQWRHGLIVQFRQVISTQNVFCTLYQSVVIWIDSTNARKNSLWVLPFWETAASESLTTVLLNFSEFNLDPGRGTNWFLLMKSRRGIESEEKNKKCLKSVVIFCTIATRFGWIRVSRCWNKK